MKRYQDVVLFLLVLAVIAQAAHIVVRPGQVAEAVPAGQGVWVGDKVSALTGQSADGVPAVVPLDVDRNAVTVLYAFNSECAFCDDVAPEWAAHFATPSPATSAVRRIAITRDLPGPAASYAERFGWRVELLSVSLLEETSRESSLVSRTPWVYVFDSDGVLRFQDHGAELRRMEEAIAALRSPGPTTMSGGGG